MQLQSCGKTADLRTVQIKIKTVLHPEGKSHKVTVQDAAAKPVVGKFIGREKVQKATWVMVTLRGLLRKVNSRTWERLTKTD